VAILILLLIGFVCKFLTGQLHSLLLPMQEGLTLLLILMWMSVAGVLYLAAAIALVMQVPSLAGMEQAEVKLYWAKFCSFIYRRNV
jgi:hypothetical protein